MSVARPDDIGRFRPSRETLAWGGVLVIAEVLLVLLYVLGSDNVTIYEPVTLLVLPWVWINVGLWAIVRTRPLASGRRKRLLAGAIGAGYFLVLAYVGGIVAPATGPATGLTPHVAAVPPGWGPFLTYQGSLVDLTLMPYNLVGYTALAYLVYATALDASNVLVGGLVGLFSCVSCTFPIIASVLTGLVGSGAALAGLANTNAYLLSTAVFVLTVGLLYWRPFGR
jgi:hypothetical protein